MNPRITKNNSTLFIIKKENLEEKKKIEEFLNNQEILNKTGSYSNVESNEFLKNGKGKIGRYSSLPQTNIIKIPINGKNLILKKINLIKN